MRTLAWIACFLPLAALASEPDQLQLKVTVDPQSGTLQSTATLELPEARQSIEFNLASDLKIESSSAQSLGAVSNANGIETYRASFATPTRALTLTYSGVLRHPEISGESDCMIRPDGAVLLDSCAWYPVIAGDLYRFTIAASLPEGWSFVSEGYETLPGVRTEDSPQEGIHLVAAPFHVTEGGAPGDSRHYRVFLHDSDPGLAGKLLGAIPGIIARYEKMFGAYPYREFNVVENLYETGYGMPGFTLLGPQVLRFPFLLTSSFPHEILHDWWGNGVYVDYSDGNWSEGLTSYLADHYEQELQGKGAAYRLKAILNYQNYAASGQDFPLRKFVGRHSNVTQAVGYSKSLMFFHMLRVRFGDATFFGALRRFYAANLHQAVGFTAIERAFEAETGQSLRDFFSQWIDHTGAPTLRLTDAKKTRTMGSWSLSLKLEEMSSPSYDLSVPLTITYQDGSSSSQLLRLQGGNASYDLSLSKEPVHIDVDPNSDVLRTLDPEEKPVTLSALFAAQKVAVFKAPGDEGAQAILQSWIGALGFTTHESSLSETLASPDPALIFGDSTEIRSALAPLLNDFGARLDGDHLVITGKSYALSTDSFALAIRSASNPGRVILWIRALPAVQPAEWAGRLLHYGSSSALVFEGRTNVYQALWTSHESPLKRDL